MVKLKKIICNSYFIYDKDYKGGELEFDFRNLDPDKKRKQIPKKCTKEILS